MNSQSGNPSKDKLVNIHLTKRPTLRGLKKCLSCGQLNGQRAHLCRNANCELRKRSQPFEPVLLVSSQKDTKIYSLRCKEREPQPRCFVVIKDVPFALEQKSSVLLTRKASCFIDACRNANFSGSKFSCKHIKACTGEAEVQAEAYPVTYDALCKLNVNEEQKQSLWKLCEDNAVPVVQRLNATTFAVKCGQSEVFPAGLLHVTAVSNGVFTKKPMYACSCKKLKIIVEPDNSLVMQEEICDHLLLVLAAVLVKPNRDNLYSEFLDALRQFWLPDSLEATVTHIEAQEDSFMGLNISQGAIDQAMSSDELLICLFGNDYIANEQLSDFACKDAEKTSVLCSSNSVVDAESTDVLFAGDPNLVSSCNIHEEEEEHDMKFGGAVGTYEDNVETTTHLQLTDCNIELMDQFQLTDQIDLSSADISIPMDGEPINILAVPSLQTESVASQAVVTTTTTSINRSVPQSQISNNSVPLIPLLPPIELPTIAVIKKPQIKAADIVTEVKTRVHPHIPANRAIIVNSTNPTITSVSSSMDALISAAPALSYMAWLDYVIESLNESVVPAELPEVFIEKSFDVHVETFSHFCKSFSTGIKRRTPTDISLVTQGRHKGLNKYSWFFISQQTVKRIFTSQNLTLQTERIYEKKTDGSFTPYVRKPFQSDLEKRRRLYPRLSSYVVNIMFGNDQSTQRTYGLQIAWTPNVLPTSKFGLLSMEFTLKTHDHSLKSI